MEDLQGSDPVLPEATVEGVPSSTDGPNNRPANEIKLWTPRGIGWASVLLGFPGAIVLAALNWRRMNRTPKAVVHLAAAVVGTWALFFVNAGSVGLAVGLAVGYYLFRAQRTDQSKLALVDRVTERSGLAGAVLAIVGTLVIVGSGALVAAAAGIGGVAHRGDVLFAMRAGTDACSPSGQATVFGPSDPIFVVAVMRETVQTGAHVVFEIDGPGVTVGPSPVTAQPPFDCLGTTESIGPLDPGIYVVRYRYDGQPGTPDLARGTFTITAGPGLSAAPPPTAGAGGSAGDATSPSAPAPTASSWHVTATIPVGVKPFRVSAADRVVSAREPRHDRGIVWRSDILWVTAGVVAWLR